MRESNRSQGARYLVAIAATVFAGLLRWALDPLLDFHLPYATFFIAILVAGWAGGWRPATLTAGLSFLIAFYLFVPPRFSMTGAPGQYLFGAAVYFVVSALIIMVTEAMRNAQNQAQQQEELLRTTLASIGDAVITTDGRGNVTFLNPMAQNLTGWASADARGIALKDVLKIINEETREPVEDPVQKVLRFGHVVGMANHTILISKDGTERPIDDSAAPIRHADGSISGVVLVFRDVSARREVELERHETQAQVISILESIPDAFMRLDQQWRFVYVNAEYERSFKRSRESQIGKSFWDEWPDAVGSLVETEFRRAITERRPIEFENYYAPFDRWYALKACPTANKELAVFVQDITNRKQAEDAMRASEQRFRLAAEAVNAIIYDYDVLSGRVDRTEGLFRVLGYRPEEVPATVDWWWKQLHPEDLKELQTKFPPHAPLAVGRGETRYRVRHKDGHYVCVSDRSIAVQDDSGRIVRQVGCTTDITTQVEAEQELRASERREQERATELETVLRATPTPIWIAHDRACQYITGNPASYRLLEMAEKQNISATGPAPAVQKRGFREYRNGVPVPVNELPMQVAATHGVSVNGVELTLVFENGHVRTIYGNAAPLWEPDGTVRGSIAAFMDITAIKEAEKRLRETDRRKDEFLATLAHELRNPLAPISNAVEFLKAKASTEPSFAWGLGVIGRQVQTMARLLEDLLDVSRISRNKLALRKERIDLMAVIQRAVETSRPVIDIGGHELSISLPHEPVMLEADPVRLAQVFSNLLNNAAKYTPGGGHIRLTATRDGNDITVSIKDDGIGISAEMLPRLFQIFSQAEPALERSQGGLGIGLSLVRGLVELHGGRIEAQSDGPGHGSEFIIRLPVLTTQPASAPAQSGRAGTQKCSATCKVLVADDNRDSADTMSMMLETLGHDVCTAYDGAEALRTAERSRPAVAILDIGMPALNGYEVCERIRAQPWGKNMVLIALTGWGQEDDRRRAEDAGFDHHLVKPVNPTTIAALLSSVQAGSA